MCPFCDGETEPTAHADMYRCLDCCSYFEEDEPLPRAPKAKRMRENDE